MAGRENTVRIIGGQWRRRLLRFPDALGLRPTPDRVRETLFNWLGQDLDGLHCLDLFAGSGALGFEAASRGAASVVLLDAAPAVVTALKANADVLGGAGVQVRRGDALQFASANAKPFDVIFIDPPYRQGWLERLTPLIDRLAGPDSRLYVESEAPFEAWPGWQVSRQGKAGQVYFHLVERSIESGSAQGSLDAR